VIAAVLSITPALRFDEDTFARGAQDGAGWKGFSFRIACVAHRAIGATRPPVDQFGGPDSGIHHKATGTYDHIAGIFRHLFRGAGTKRKQSCNGKGLNTRFHLESS